MNSLLMRDGICTVGVSKMLVHLGLIIGMTTAVVLMANTISKLHLERRSLRQQVRALQDEAEETASRMTSLAVAQKKSKPVSQVLRLRGEVSQLSRELADLSAASPTNFVSSSNRFRRDEIASEAIRRFQAQKEVRGQQLALVHGALIQFADQADTMPFFNIDGQPSPEISRLFPSLPWRELEILCHDSKTLRFLQANYPEEFVAMFTDPLLDASGSPVRTAVCANGTVVTEPESDLFQRMKARPKPADEGTALNEIQQSSRRP